VEELQNIPSEVRKVGIVAQTTIELKVFEAIIQKCKERFEEVVFYNTICDATSIRQREAEELSKKADVFVVVGGKNSSNTNKLVKICKQNQKDTYHIEEMQEIDPNWFIGKTKIAVTGGASTPHEFVDNVGSYIASLVQNNG
jgi:4-hydroxy-3-methylbut-2-enyl diphosphate reductase